jgi:hypothetical protein
VTIAGGFSIKLKGIARKKKIVIKTVGTLKSLYTGDPTRAPLRRRNEEEKKQAVPEGASCGTPSTDHHG